MILEEIADKCCLESEVQIDDKEGQEEGCYVTLGRARVQSHLQEDLVWVCVFCNLLHVPFDSSFH